MIEKHPIEGLIFTAMDSIKGMIDINTIIGEKIQINEDISIIPISKVGFGFAAGGSDFSSELLEDYKKNDVEENISYKNPFGGGSGAGVSIKPVAFLVIQKDIVKLLPVEHNCTIDRVLDYIPELYEKTEQLLAKIVCKKENNDNP